MAESSAYFLSQGTNFPTRLLNCLAERSRSLIDTVEERSAAVQLVTRHVVNGLMDLFHPFQGVFHVSGHLIYSLPCSRARRACERGNTG